jgi:hypothetical protein
MTLELVTWSRARARKKKKIATTSRPRSAPSMKSITMANRRLQTSLNEYIRRGICCPINDKSNASCRRLSHAKLSLPCPETPNAQRRCLSTNLFVSSPFTCLAREFQIHPAILQFQKGDIQNWLVHTEILVQTEILFIHRGGNTWSIRNIVQRLTILPSTEFLCKFP